MTQEQEAAKNSTAIANLANVEVESLDAGITNQIAVADSQAAEVDRKLKLSAVEVHLPASLAVGSGDVNYIYTSSADKINNWVISISNSSGKFVRSWTVKEDYIGDPTVINRDFWKTNYAAALQIAEKNAGLEYRNNHEITQVILRLKNAQPKGWLYWFVDYYSAANMKEIQIDAGNGSIVLPADQ